MPRWFSSQRGGKVRGYFVNWIPFLTIGTATPPPCGSWLASDGGRETAAECQVPSVIVDDHRRQAGVRREVGSRSEMDRCLAPFQGGGL